MVSYVGASRKGLDYAGFTSIGDSQLGFNAPLDMRVDKVAVNKVSTKLRYVNCPEGPFIEDNGQSVCE